MRVDGSISVGSNLLCYSQSISECGILRQSTGLIWLHVMPEDCWQVHAITHSATRTITMPTAIKMPKLGESVIEGTISRWLKAPGDQIDKLEPLLEISTDKIDTKIPAPDSGIFLQIDWLSRKVQPFT